MENENKVCCPECGNEELTFDFRNQYHDFWICKNCGNKIRTKKEENKGDE